MKNTHSTFPNFLGKPCQEELNTKPLSNPWKGLEQYTEEDFAKFKGRDQDIGILYDLIERNSMTVLYAQSGVGKSSLLRAGLTPLLNNYIPIQIAFTDDFLESSIPFEQYIIDEIRSKVEQQGYQLSSIKDHPKYQKDDYVKSVDDKLQDCLWWILNTSTLLKNIQKGKRTVSVRTPQIPILLFDQFEEVFTKSLTESRIAEIFYLLHTLSRINLPGIVVDAYREVAQTMHIALKSPLSHQGNCFKVLLSLRDDYMGQFDYWVNQRFAISALLQNRYCLYAMKYEQTRNVITYCPEVCFEENAIQLMMDILDGDKKGVVEPLLLSLMCYQLFEKSGKINQGEHKTITTEEVEKHGRLLLSNFYHVEMQKAIHSSKRITQIEDLLVSDKGIRIRRYSKDLKKYDLEQLLKHHLVRTTDGNEYVELIHDSLAKIVQEKREKIRLLNKQKRKVLCLKAGVAVFLSMLIFYIANAIINIPVKVNTRLFLSLGNDTLVCNAFSPFRPGNIGIIDVENGLVDFTDQNLAIIGENSFYGNQDIQKVIIPDIVDIYENAFRNCYNLTSVEWGNKVRFIYDNAFKNCYQLQNIAIPPSMESIGKDAFSGCKQVKFTILNNPKFKEYDGVLLQQLEKPNCWYAVYIPYHVKQDEDTSHAAKEIIEYIDTLHLPIEMQQNSIEFNGIPIVCKYEEQNKTNKKTELIIPDSVSSIPKWAYAGNKALRKVTFLHRFMSIEEGAFKGCANLQEVNIPNWLFVNPRTFEGCIGLEKIEFSDGFFFIGVAAFKNCQNLKEASIPNTVKHLSESMFEGCSRLKKVKLPKNKELSSIPNYSFKNCEVLDSIIVPDNFKQIEYQAFAGCTNLKYIQLPDTCVLSTQVFQDCNSLEELIIPEGTASLGLSGCSSLRKLHLPSTIRYISSDIFEQCPHLVEISISANNNKYCIKEGIIWDKEEDAPCYYSLVKYHTLNNDSYTSIDGILYKKGENGEIRLEHIPKEVAEWNIPDNLYQNRFSNSIIKDAEKLKKMRISITNPRYYIYDDVLYEKQQLNSDESLELVYYIGERELITLPYYILGKGLTLLDNISMHFDGLLISDNQRQAISGLAFESSVPPNLTLNVKPDTLINKLKFIVPYGCKGYYDNSEFSNFRRIEESSWYETVSYPLKFELRGVKNFWEVNPWLWGVCCFVLALISIGLYVLFFVYYRYSWWISIIRCIEILVIGAVVYILAHFAVIRTVNSNNIAVGVALVLTLAVETIYIYLFDSRMKMNKKM